MNSPLHIVCPHCQGINRVPEGRLLEHPNCGRCHQALFTAQPVELSGTAFARTIEHHALPVLVDFWAPWCGPCRAMAPQFEQAATLLEPRVRLAKVNTEVEQHLAARFGIRSIPTLILFNRTQEVARHSGAMGAQGIVHWVRQYID